MEIQKSLYILIRWYLLFFYPWTAWGLQIDTQEKANFSADHLSFNQKTGNIIYTGRVKVDQGTTHLIAEKIIVYRDPDGTINTVIATGNPAYYTTLPDHQDQLLKAFGNTIEYYPKIQKAKLIGNAHLLQGENSLQSDYIIYDIVKQTLTAIPTTIYKKSFLILKSANLLGKAGKSTKEAHEFPK